jgi:hypothetical protein
MIPRKFLELLTNVLLDYFLVEPKLPKSSFSEISKKMPFQSPSIKKILPKLEETREEREKDTQEEKEVEQFEDTDVYKTGNIIGENLSDIAMRKMESFLFKLVTGLDIVGVIFLMYLFFYYNQIVHT